ncbi:hypothetical protein NIES4075_29290 [Tolypothrix sp. NIES-4075]|nr:hypothetical protein NIES4075_29290 [Tolypothrix sp. NIES-4075]
MGEPVRSPNFLPYIPKFYTFKQPKAGASLKLSPAFEGQRILAYALVSTRSPNAAILI